ncbi:hypothetical protein [Rufibacter hautae]|uniref:Tissue inhibitor of metalloproteinase n=1 Tax=Rufibacter hautae TaxID=2595005 RepID=A0A5B6TMI6_9BACT|nr:hypothetical protein [Rufibacter hautae]KAA3440555.1 hypothetical protein FOA19_07855 [Rufibacter hautae]
MKKYILLAVMTLIWLPAISCSCGTARNFIKATQKADIIALVKIKEYQDFFTLTGAGPEPINQPQSVQVEVVQVLKGKEERKEVKIYGDDGALCRPYIDVFKKDQFYVIGLYKGDSEAGEDYAVSICGEFWLEYDQKLKTVKGRIEENRQKPKVLRLNNLQTLLTKV